MTAVFAAMQKAYARYGVATYPLRENKRPAVTNFQRVGLPASRKLAEKYANADAFGFIAGDRNGLTIIDIDNSDEHLLRDVEERFGPTPLHAGTPSGGWHLYYRHNGEPRRIRPMPDVDVLGSGPVVGIGSRVAHGEYTIERGTIDDLSRLPIARYVHAVQRTVAGVPVGQRNKAVFRHCMQQARHCDTLDDLLDVARTFNGNLPVSLPDSEVIKTAQSAWGYEERGQNRFGQPGVSLTKRHIDELWSHGDALLLFMRLRAINGAESEFWIADGYASELGWTLLRLRKARNALQYLGYIARTRRGTPGWPATYRWGPR